MEMVKVFKIPQRGLCLHYVDLKDIHWGLITLCFYGSGGVRDIIPFQIILPAENKKPLLSLSPSGRIFMGNISHNFNSNLCRVSLLGSFVQIKGKKKIFRNYLIIGARVVIVICDNIYLVSHKKLMGVDWVPM